MKATKYYLTEHGQYLYWLYRHCSAQESDQNEATELTVGEFIHKLCNFWMYGRCDACGMQRNLCEVNFCLACSRNSVRDG